MTTCVYFGVLVQIFLEGSSTEFYEKINFTLQLLDIPVTDFPFATLGICHYIYCILHEYYMFFHEFSFSQYNVFDNHNAITYLRLSQLTFWKLVEYFTSMLIWRILVSIVL